MVLRHGALDEGRELRAEQLSRTRTSSPATTSPTLLNTTTMIYTPDTSQELCTTLGGGGDFWEQTLRLCGR